MRQRLLEPESATRVIGEPPAASGARGGSPQTATEPAGGMEGTSAWGSDNTSLQSWFNVQLQSEDWTFYVKQDQAEPMEDEGEAAEMRTWMERSRRARRNWLRENL